MSSFSILLPCYVLTLRLFDVNQSKWPIKRLNHVSLAYRGDTNYDPVSKYKISPFNCFWCTFSRKPYIRPCFIYLISINRQNMLLAHNRNFSGRKHKKRILDIMWQRVTQLQLKMWSFHFLPDCIGSSWKAWKVQILPYLFNFRKNTPSAPHLWFPSPGEDVPL